MMLNKSCVLGTGISRLDVTSLSVLINGMADFAALISADIPAPVIKRRVQSKNGVFTLNTACYCVDMRLVIWSWRRLIVTSHPVKVTTVMMYAPTFARMTVLEVTSRTLNSSAF